MGISIEVWGKNACFTRPEFKTERVSYDVITPSAAVGIFRAIYWHPGVSFVIDRIRVLSPIKFENIRRNEVRSKAKVSSFKAAMESENPSAAVLVTEGIMRQQRSTMMLKDVRYVIDAHYDIDKAQDTKELRDKVTAILGNRLKRGQCFEQPCLGLRECVANVKIAEGEYECPEELKGRRDLGFMLHSFDYSNPSDPVPRFFRAVMEDGVIKVPAENSEEVKG